ncbi:type I-MYXAN CRISPR-associated protein Cas6/Cmx6 [Ferrigenium sp. UT5]|uniref:type I-MYXAN CRISPR-associated protein Cas6/Cmx6 n=1 Tax=Ferrigenium sp. UT5 TaxID=3242105 RepID=UPI00354FFB2B
MQTIAMTEISIALNGTTLPPGYPFALWEALVRHQPRLAESSAVGIVPLRTAANEGKLLLSKRTRLLIRLPEEMADAVAALNGKMLEIDGHRLQLGSVEVRGLQPYPTLHAPLVSGGADEITFMRGIRASLDAMAIGAGLICGKRVTLKSAAREISGYSLVVHDLKPEESLRLQGNGLGAEKCFGCGVFLPYKAITSLE